MNWISNFAQFLNENGQELTKAENESLNESTFRNFEPTRLNRSTEIDLTFFKKLMPKTAATVKDAEKRIFSFEGGTMFAHYQYFIVKPHGNIPDLPTYRLGNSQYWLNDAQLGMMGRKGESVNVTLLSITDITDPKNEKKLGSVWVDTKVYLDEQPRVFEILDRKS